MAAKVISVGVGQGLHCAEQLVPDGFTVDTSQDAAETAKSFWHPFENVFKKGQRQDRRKGRPEQ